VEQWHLSQGYLEYYRTSGSVRNKSCITENFHYTRLTKLLLFEGIEANFNVHADSSRDFRGLKLVLEVRKHWTLLTFYLPKWRIQKNLMYVVHKHRLLPKLAGSSFCWSIIYVPYCIVLCCSVEDTDDALLQAGYMTMNQDNWIIFSWFMLDTWCRPGVCKCVWLLASWQKPGLLIDPRTSWTSQIAILYKYGGICINSNTNYWYKSI